MDKLVAFYQGQDKRRLAILGLATVATFVAILFLTRMATAPRMELLFANLEPAAAGEVVAALEGRGVTHDVRGRSIYVDGAQRDSLRLQLAGEGLPRSDGAGYELLDGLSGFGTTSQMFDAAYWRAREGELTRTILAGTGVKLARVHLATADSSPFARDRTATASVTLQMNSGAVGLSLAQAVQSLVAGAVRDLSPDAVTVIDAANGRIVGGTAIDSDAERRDARLAEMRTAVENLLEARVGADRYVVELALETTTTTETITERVLDPDSRVVISTDTEERSASDRGAANAGVTVASNLPDGDAGGGGDQESNSAETRERVNYDFSATQRQIERAPGAIERVTVAVLVDGLRGGEVAEGTEWAPRPEDELEMLQDLVRSAVGFRAERGDEVTVRTMQFGPPPAIEAAPGLSLPWLSGGQMTQIVTSGLLALVAIGALFVLAKLMARRPPLLDDSPALAAPGDGLSTQAPGSESGDLAALSGPVSSGSAPDDDLPSLPDLSDLGNLPMSQDALPALGGAGAEDDPVERLRQLISDRREETLEVLRGWMEDAPEDAR